jgi:HEAT repeat protein
MRRGQNRAFLTRIALSACMPAMQKSLAPPDEGGASPSRRVFPTFLFLAVFKSPLPTWHQAILTPRFGLWAGGVITLAGLFAFALHKRKYIQIAVLQRMNKTQQLLRMYVNERDRDVARAAERAMTKTSGYQGFFEHHNATKWLLGSIESWASTGNIARITALLGDPNQTVDKAAIETLAKLGASPTQMADGYLAVLSSTAQSYYKSHAIDELRKLGDKRAVKPLLNFLNHGDVHVRTSAHLALESLGASKQQMLDRNFAAASSKDLHVRQNAVWELAGGGDKRAIEPLLVMLGDSEKRVRSMAETFLVQLGASNEQIVNGYIAVLSSTDLKRDLEDDFQYTRVTALERLVDVIGILGKLGNKSAVDPLAKLLAFNHSVVRSCAMEALEKIGASKERMAEGYIVALASKNMSIRIEAANRLGNLGDQRAIDPLLGLLKDEARETRSSGERALTQLGACNRVTDVYLEILRSQPRPAGYSAILDYFVQVGAVGVVGPLISLIYAPRPGFEIFYKDILKAIGKIGDRTAVAPLSQLLNSRWKWVTVDSEGRQTTVKETGSEWIREDIMKALGMLGGEGATGQSQ